MNNTNFVNFYQLKEVKEKCPASFNPHFKQTDIKIPSRVCLQGSSGSGKTQQLLNYIYLSPDTWARITIVTKAPETLYDYLQAKLGDKIDVFYNLSKLPNEPKDFNPSKDNHLLVFDDQIATKDQTRISNYFIYGRKWNITLFYLSQNFYSIPKTVRAQFSYLLIVKINSKRDLNLILRDSGSIEIDKLKEIYEDATKEQFNFLKISIEESDVNRKFSHNWNQFYKIE